MELYERGFRRYRILLVGKPVWELIPEEILFRREWRRCIPVNMWRKNKRTIGNECNDDDMIESVQCC